MLLAINYSPAAARLVESGKINIDYFKTPNWDWIITEARLLRPVAVHFTLDAGNNHLVQANWDEIDQMAQTTGTPYINLHLDARQCDYPELRINTSDTMDIERVYKTIRSDVMAVVERFGAERVIVENSPYQGREGNTLGLCIQPGLIKRLVAETGCGLLLDISHAIVTAKHLGMGPEEYISQLPVDKVKELHFAGIHEDLANGGWMDHLSIQQDDWHWLDWAFRCIQVGAWSKPWLLAFEYGGVGEPFAWRTDPEVISTQVPELYEHMRVITD